MQRGSSKYGYERKYRKTEVFLFTNKLIYTLINKLDNKNIKKNKMDDDDEMDDDDITLIEIMEGKCCVVGEFRSRWKMVCQSVP